MSTAHGYKGITQNAGGKWRPQIGIAVDGKQKELYLGYHSTEDAAAHNYDM